MPIDTLRLENDRRLVSALLGLMLLPLVWYLGIDLLEHFRDSRPLAVNLVTRATCFSVPVVGLLLVRWASTREAYARAVFGISIAMAVLLLALSLQRPFSTASAQPILTATIFLIALYAGMPNTFYRQITAPLIFTAGFMLELLFGTTANSGTLANDMLTLVFLNLAGINVVHRRRVLEREVSALLGKELLARADAERALKELKTLRGIIRICSYCRKIHNEAGVWQQIETYVRDHSHAEFSHGICPECVTEHFPQPAG